MTTTLQIAKRRMPIFPIDELAKGRDFKQIEKRLLRSTSKSSIIAYTYRALMDYYDHKIYYRAYPTV